MADTTGIYILENKDGFRVTWGSQVEHSFHRNMSKTFHEHISNLPLFPKYEHALNFAKCVETANKTARGIMLISNYREYDIDDLIK